MCTDHSQSISCVDTKGYPICDLHSHQRPYQCHLPREAQELISMATVKGNPSTQFELFSLSGPDQAAPVSSQAVLAVISENVTFLQAFSAVLISVQFLINVCSSQSLFLQQNPLDHCENWEFLLVILRDQIKSLGHRDGF